MLLTHDVNAMREAAYERIAASLTTLGVFLLGWGYPIGQAIDELELLAGASLDDEWEDQVRYLPVR